ncbi:hypothetical protein POM88_026403 [Heracleum sosnowskyi]|uniref:Uncharacterized protein n=1 Tax=Heracleum sosnowskyi TaxID=360622 RepID=A0AAD8I5S0_9APIA|nr:hypothetical protein POM88_026403 [Heracleum sosnowskyi]
MADELNPPHVPDYYRAFRTRSDCREANRRTKDVSTKYEHVNKFWVVTAISQCADLKVKYSEILNNKQSEESFIMKVFFRCCPFSKAETSMSYSTMHSRMENLESLAWEIQKTQFQFDRIYTPTIKDGGWKKKKPCPWSWNPDASLVTRSPVDTPIPSTASEGTQNQSVSPDADVPLMGNEVGRSTPNTINQ